MNLKWEAYTNCEGEIICLDAEFKALKGRDDLLAIMTHMKQKESFEGKPGELAHVTLNTPEGIRSVVLVSVGTAESFSGEKLTQGLASAFRYLKGKKVETIGVALAALSKVTDVNKALARRLGEVFIMSAYSFDAYKTDAKPNPVKDICFHGIDVDADAFEEGRILGETNVFSRTLVNMPANILTPKKLAELAKAYGEEAGAEVEIKEQAEIEALGMEAYLSVAKASDNPPQLIVMRYTGNPGSERRLGLVGKGLTYDSGGLSIKPTSGMVTMKCDMGGAAAMIGALGAIARLKLKVNVTAVVAACENMISGIAYKPGDIIGSMGGKSIYIGNTDAEGRLTLIDAMYYIMTKEAVTEVVDMATLTGAAIHCTGDAACPMISNNDDFAHMVLKSFDKADEKIWRMPIFEEYKELVKHEQADLTNTAGSPGTITAGLFVGAYVGDMPWAHVDIAGTAFKKKTKAPFSDGATGSGARPMVYLAKKMAE